MEADLKIFKVAYLSNNRSDLNQIWNWNSGDQTNLFSSFKYGKPALNKYDPHHQ